MEPVQQVPEAIAQASREGKGVVEGAARGDLGQRVAAEEHGGSGGAVGVGQGAHLRVRDGVVVDPGVDHHGAGGCALAEPLCVERPAQHGGVGDRLGEGLPGGGQRSAVPPAPGEDGVGYAHVGGFGEVAPPLGVEQGRDLLAEDRGVSLGKAHHRHAQNPEDGVVVHGVDDLRKVRGRCPGERTDDVERGCVGGGVLRRGGGAGIDGEESVRGRAGVGRPAGAGRDDEGGAWAATQPGEGRVQPYPGDGHGRAVAQRGGVQDPGGVGGPALPQEVGCGGRADGYAGLGGQGGRREVEGVVGVEERRGLGGEADPVQEGREAGDHRNKFPSEKCIHKKIIPSGSGPGKRRDRAGRCLQWCPCTSRTCRNAPRTT